MTRGNTAARLAPGGESRGAALLRYASPQAFFPVAGKLIPCIASLAAISAPAGGYAGFALAPTAAQQGEVHRITHLQVAAAGMSMLLYGVMAGWAALGFALRTRTGLQGRHLRRDGE